MTITLGTTAFELTFVLPTQVNPIQQSNIALVALFLFFPFECSQQQNSPSHATGIISFHQEVQGVQKNGGKAGEWIHPTRYGS